MMMVVVESEANLSREIKIRKKGQREDEIRWPKLAPTKSNLICLSISPTTTADPRSRAENGLIDWAESCSAQLLQTDGPPIHPSMRAKLSAFTASLNLSSPIANKARPGSKV